MDEWCETVRSHLNGGEIPSNFIGHCCELKLEVGPPKPNVERRFDGYMHLPEYGLMFCPNLDGLDVHAFGKDKKNNLDGVLHAVVDENTAIDCELLNVVPDGSGARILNYHTRVFKYCGELALVRSYMLEFNCLSNEISNLVQYWCR